MNFNILFLKIEELSAFLTLLSSLFHSVTVNGTYVFLKKVYLTLFLVLCVLLMVGILLNGFIYLFINFILTWRKS